MHDKPKAIHALLNFNRKLGAPARSNLGRNRKSALTFSQTPGGGHHALARPAHSAAHQPELSLPGSPERAGHGAMVVDPRSGSIVDVNKRMTLLSGYSRDQLLRMNFADLGPDDAHQIFASILRDVGESGEAICHQTLVCSDGKSLDVEISAWQSEIEGQTFILGLVRDKTAHKLAANMLRDSLDWLSLAVDSSNIGLWNWNLGSNKVDFSREW
jgi:PAS domain S-box-containing protein